MTRPTLILLALGACALLAACGEAPALPEDIRPVRVAAVQEAPAETTLLFSGEIVPRIETALGFRVAGKMTERRVDLGAQVEAGQVLARLDPRDLELSERSARASVAAAQSQLELARADLTRQRALLERGHIAQAQFDRYETQFRAAQANLDQTQAQARERANQTVYATLAADAAGIVTSVDAEPGQVLGVGQTVMKIARLDAREVAIAVPETQIGLFAAGASVSVESRAQPGRAIDGRVREISGMADRATRTYRVRVEIPGAPPEFKLGMTANVAFRTPSAVAGFVVPLPALAAREGGNFVWIVGDERASLRPVSLVGTQGENLVVTGDLKRGERIVTAGVNLLRDGQRVRVAGTAP